MKQQNRFPDQERRMHIDHPIFEVLPATYSGDQVSMRQEF
jgi:hypothetical protein